MSEGEITPNSAPFLFFFISILSVFEGPIEELMRGFLLLPETTRRSVVPFYSV